MDSLIFTGRIVFLIGLVVFIFTFLALWMISMLIGKDGEGTKNFLFCQMDWEKMLKSGTRFMFYGVLIMIIGGIIFIIANLIQIFL